jgi:uncharacterized membrane protein YozB (DUF420 family)
MSINLPLLDAMLNGLAAVLLVAGLLAIKKGQRVVHERLMKRAFVVSCLFLASYLYYHLAIAKGHPKTFNGEGWTRPAYFTLLISHTVLAVVNLPLVLRTLWLAHKERWDAHKRIAKVTFPIWLYVSVTGVVVYVVLYHWNPPAPVP